MSSFLKSFIRNPRLIVVLWLLIIAMVSIKHNFISSFPNNYKIFKYTAIHAMEGKLMYGHYPAQYDDKNHYGPFFSLLVTPFALLPDWAGHLLWVTFLIVSVLLAVRSLPIEDWQKNVIALICFNELLTAAFNVQFNIAVAAFIILAFTLIQREKEFWAPLPILIGTFVKLYGIVGFAFFFLVKNKPRFILASVVWSIVLLVAPMVISSPEYVLNMYGEWYRYLVIKNSENISLVSYQDISIMGFFRRLLADPTLPNTPFLAAGVLLFGLPYLRISQYKNKAYQMLLLCSTLMFPVIFSSSSESPTYVIVFLGVAIWFVIQPRPYHWSAWLLLALAMLFGSFATADFYPYEWRVFLRLHSVKAVPCLFVWLMVIYEMMTRDFGRYQLPDLAAKPAA